MNVIFSTDFPVETQSCPVWWNSLQQTVWFQDEIISSSKDFLHVDVRVQNYVLQKRQFFRLSLVRKKSYNRCNFRIHHAWYLRRHMKIDHQREATFPCSYGQSAMNSNATGSILWRLFLRNGCLLDPIAAMHHTDCLTSCSIPHPTQIPSHPSIGGLFGKAASSSAILAVWNLTLGLGLASRWK